MNSIHKDTNLDEVDSVPKAKRANKRQTSNPLQYSKGLIVKSKAEKDCLVNESDAEKELFGSYREPLVPYLVWVAPVDREKDSKEETSNNKYGWILCLSGLQTGYEDIASAAWDDSEGIKNLVELLEDGESLLALATLAFPNAMESASKNLVAYNILDKYGEPSVETKFRSAEAKLSEAIRWAERSNQTYIHDTFFLRIPIVFSFDLNGTDWRYVFFSFTQKQKARYKAKAFRKIVEETGFYVVEDIEWLKRHYEYSLTPLSKADWLEVYRTLGANFFGKPY